MDWPTMRSNGASERGRQQDSMRIGKGTGAGARTRDDEAKTARPLSARSHFDGTVNPQI